MKDDLCPTCQEYTNTAMHEQAKAIAELVTALDRACNYYEHSTEELEQWRALVRRVLSPYQRRMGALDLWYLGDGDRTRGRIFQRVE